MSKICVWPNGDYCWPEFIHEHKHNGNQYVMVTVNVCEYSWDAAKRYLSSLK